MKKKLTLKKETIASLEANQMNILRGGNYPNRTNINSDGMTICQGHKETCGDNCANETLPHYGGCTETCQGNTITESMYFLECDDVL